MNRESGRSKAGTIVSRVIDQDPDTGPKVTTDRSYREILGEAAWNRLQPEVRQRFSAKPQRGKAICYDGEMHIIELSYTGWLFAQACRLIGTPLAPWRGTDVAMTIDLVPDENLRGVAWMRRYQFSPSKSFTVRSTKCQGRNGEFIEHIGRGFSMRLKLSEESGKLVFKSVAYELRLPGKLCRFRRC